MTRIPAIGVFAAFWLSFVTGPAAAESNFSLDAGVPTVLPGTSQPRPAVMLPAFTVPSRQQARTGFEAGRPALGLPLAFDLGGRIGRDVERATLASYGDWALRLSRRITDRVSLQMQYAGTCYYHDEGNGHYFMGTLTVHF